MGILKKSTKLVLSLLMFITCSNFFTVRAEDGEETNYSEPVLVETVNEETTSDSLEEVLDEPVIEEVIGEEVIDETVVVKEKQEEVTAEEFLSEKINPEVLLAEEVESVVKTEPSKLVVKSENEEQLEDEEVEEEIVLSRAMRKVAPVYDATTVIEVPHEGMVIENGIFYGISETWYKKNFPENQVIEISLTIPSDVTTISNDAFRANYTNVKENKGCITTNKFKVVNIDFSNATNLIKIENQVAMECSSLHGTLDFSNTKLEYIGKNAFNGCKNLTGVILPQTVKNIGDASSGSVFKDCTSLQFLRVANGNPSSNFELPNHLETIGYQSFYNCSSLPANTMVSIPESVTFIGDEAFYKSNNITTILIQTDNASGYGNVAFKGNNYGISNRLTVFKNLAAKNSYPAGGNNSYKESLTYEFTLNYDTIKTEKKLWGQPVSVCKDDAGNWYNNVEYTIPSGEWSYNNLALTKTTVLKPDGDELTLKVSYALREPTIQFIVDGEVIETTGTHLELNLSNNKEHTIGVKASHHAQTDPNSNVNIKFEYKWTDIWGLGTEGPRMNESGFGRYNLWDNPNVTNTITINGPTHERTKRGNYSSEDYGDGYYLVEIYGYYTPKTGGERKLFYKSASTAIGIADSERTTDTVYSFEVVTSDPASAPKVDFVVDEAVYGYEDAKKIEATVEDIDGQTNTYQWYRASKDEPHTNGEKIDGATSPTLDIETRLNAGEYYYYLEVTSKKALNNDVSQMNHPVTFIVTKADMSIEAESYTKKYDGKPLEGKAYPVVTEDTVVTYRTKEKEEGTWSDWKSEIPAITNAGKLWVEAKTENPNYKDATVAYTLEVTKLEITLTSGSASKEYDGKPLTKLGVVISGDKFIEDEVTDVQATGTITNVGSVDNTIKIVATDKFNENNYAIKYELGKLTITKKPDPKTEPTEKPKGCPANTVWNEEKGICEAIVVPLTPIKGGGQKVTPKPTSTPAPTSKPTASPTIEPTSTPKPMATEETEIIIEPNATPEIAGKGHWALINLISAIGSVLFGILLLVSKHEDDETRKRNRIWKIVSVVDALVAIVVFALTENMKLSMVLVDKWTILMVLLIIVNVVSFAFGKKYHDEEE